MGGIIKSLGQWILYGVLLVGAAAIMLLGRGDDGMIQRFRLHVTDVLVPILDVLSRPVDGMTHAAERIQSWIWLAEENAQLKAERERLLQWQAIAQRLQAENAALRNLTRLVPDPPVEFVTARVVAASTSTFAQSIVVSAGSADGVARGNVAVSGDGLVGRVVAVSPRAAMILLITDLNSRVPVFVGESRARAILAGDNSEHPRLIHVVAETEIHAGDEVVTSGLAGGFPPGLPVGVVVDADSTTITVRLKADGNSLEYVRVIDYAVPEAPLVKPSSVASAATQNSGSMSR
jgi:rod shape-determining protein MreC